MTSGFLALMGVMIGSKFDFSSVPSKPEHLDALLLGVGLEELGDALAVLGLVVDDVGALDLHGPVGELGADHALHVVAAAHAVDVRVAAVGDHGLVLAGEIIATLTSL